MKWFALIFMLVGLLAIMKAMVMDKTSSFESGSFLVEVALFVIGGGCIVIALVMFAVLLFQSL